MEKIDEYSKIGKCLTLLLSAITSTKCFQMSVGIWTIHLNKVVSVQKYFLGGLVWGHATASQLCWGQDSKWTTLEDMFSSAEVILLVTYVSALGHCPVASPIVFWALVGTQMVLGFPARCLEKLWNGNLFWSIRPGPEAAKQPQTMMPTTWYFSSGKMLVCCVCAYFILFFSTHSVCSFQTTQCWFHLSADY